MDFETWWAQHKRSNGNVEAAWNAALDEAMRIVFENGGNRGLIEMIRTAKTHA